MKKYGIIRKSLGIFIWLLMVAMTCTIANADVIWEPNDNFYLDNTKDCVYMGRNFTANGPDGSVTIQKSPESSKKVAKVENGKTFYVSFTYTDGRDNIWGVVKLDGGATGWVQMKELVVVYDNLSFMEEHKDELKNFEGKFSVSDVEGKVVFWSYPCSGNIVGRVSNIKEDDIQFSYSYTDAEGRQWGNVGYYMGNRGWICVSDPFDETIPPVDVETAAIITPSTTTKAAKLDAPDESTFSVVILLVALVAVVMVVTLILIRMFWRKQPGK